MPKNQHLITIILLLFLALITGCKKQQQQLTSIPNNGLIVAFGDSLTVGYGVNKVSSYPSVLATLSGRRVINAGISGETTVEGLARLNNVLMANKPDLLILLEGGNDILRQLDLTETKQNLANMINLAQQQGIEVVLIGVPSKSLFTDTAPLYEQLAEQYQLAFAPSIVAELLRNSRYKSDAIHFNETGYRLLAEHIHQLLVTEGAL